MNATAAGAWLIKAVETILLLILYAGDVPQQVRFLETADSSRTAYPTPQPYAVD